MPRAADGFSLVELTVALCATMVLVGSLVMVVNPSRRIAQTIPEVIDMQQGARFALGSLQRDLAIAGAGTDTGEASGPLIDYFPPVLPRRIGQDAEARDVARSDAFSLVWVPATRVQAVLSVPLSSNTAIVSGSGCAPGLPSCGFREGMGVLLFDRTGMFDIFTATQADLSGVVLRHRGPGGTAAYAAGAFAAELSARTYYFDAAARQIRIGDTDTSDIPLLDDAVSMAVEYFGSGAAPRRPKPPPGTANCLYDAAGDRLPAPDLAGGNDIPLPLAMFRDGPWCGAGGIEFDADLLRVRRVRTTFGIRASSASLRDEAEEGTAASSWTRLTTLDVTLDVAPRNLSLASSVGP
jgi:hypothetical protein